MGGRYQTASSLSWNFGLGTGSLGSAGGNDSVIYVGIKIPLLSSKSKNNRYNDPLLREAYKKNLIDNSNDQKPLQSKDLDSYFSTEPADQDTTQQTEPIDTSYSPKEERTRRALFD